MKVWVLLHHAYGEGSDIEAVYLKQQDAEDALHQQEKINAGSSRHGFTVEEHEAQ